ncbi:MAG: hypothetical protein J7M20_00975 [Deltaproteobacteria bacterium]|nr:hypothetical protein [Deltaproteobacteria bacterium]
MDVRIHPPDGLFSTRFKLNGMTQNNLSNREIPLSGALFTGFLCTLFGANAVAVKYSLSGIGPFRMNQNTGKSLFFALTSGLLLGIPWMIPSFFFLIFVVWVPLLQLEKEIHDNRNRYALFNYVFAGFLLWNILGSWWITQAQWLGGGTHCSTWETL